MLPLPDYHVLVKIRVQGGPALVTPVEEHVYGKRELFCITQIEFWNEVKVPVGASTFIPISSDMLNERPAFFFSILPYSCCNYTITLTILENVLISELSL